MAEEGRRAADRIVGDYRAAAEAAEAAIRAEEEAAAEVSTRAAAAEAAGTVAVEVAEVADAIKKGMRSASREVVAAIRK